MSSITWPSPRYVQELATILGPQNRTQGRCGMLWCSLITQQMPPLLCGFSMHNSSYNFDAGTGGPHHNHWLFWANFTDLIKWRGRFWMSDVLMFVAAEIRLINSESPWHWRHWPGAVPLFALRINVVTNNRNSGRCTGDPLLCSLNNGRISIDFHMLTTDVFSWSQMLLATL